MMIVNLRDFHLLNLWRILSGGLGWSSRIVNGMADTSVGPELILLLGFSRYKLIVKRLCAELILDELRTVG